jgi:hypothetical protein
VRFSLKLQAERRSQLLERAIKEDKNLARWVESPKKMSQRDMSGLADGGLQKDETAPRHSDDGCCIWVKSFEDYGKYWTAGKSIKHMVIKKYEKVSIR